MKQWSTINQRINHAFFIISHKSTMFGSPWRGGLHGPPTASPFRPLTCTLLPGLKPRAGGFGEPKLFAAGNQGMIHFIVIWLVVSRHPSAKIWLRQLGWLEIPNICKNKEWQPVTTNQFLSWSSQQPPATPSNPSIPWNAPVFEKNIRLSHGWSMGRNYENLWRFFV